MTLGLLFGGIYIGMGTRTQSTGFILAYHAIMFSVLLPNLKFLVKDLYVIILKCTNKINDVEIRDFENLQQLGEIGYAIISNVGVLTAGKL